MKQALYKIMTPMVIFLVFAVMTMIAQHFVANTASIRYTGQVLTILSGFFLLNRLVNILLWDNLITRALETAVPRLIKDLSTVLISLICITLIVGVVFKQPVMGIWATSGALGVIIGFALRNLILDTFTGLAINVDNSYKIGDWVHVHSRNVTAYIGCILEINWRTTRLKTTDNNIVIIPNSIIGQSIVTNFSAPGVLSRFELCLDFDATIPSDRIVRVLLAGVKGAISPQGIEAEPAPTVRINRVTEAGIEYRIRYWHYPNKLSPPKARHAVLSGVLRNLQTAGISLAFPKREVSMVRLPKRSLNANLLEDRVALLSSIDLFHRVEPDALQSLASNITKVEYKTSDKVVTLGEKGDSMFIVIEGLLDVYVHNDFESRDVKVGHITSGQFFGEIALLTGQPRSATVIASTDVVAYEITYHCMRELFQLYPEVMEAVSSVLAERQFVQKQFLADIQPKPKIEESNETLAEEIMISIRKFFGFRRKP